MLSYKEFTEKVFECTAAVGGIPIHEFDRSASLRDVYGFTDKMVLKVVHNLLVDLALEGGKDALTMLSEADTGTEIAVNFHNYMEAGVLHPKRGAFDHVDSNASDEEYGKAAANQLLSKTGCGVIPCALGIAIVLLSLS